MIDIQLIRDNPDLVKKNLARRGVPGEAVDTLVALDEKWRKVSAQVEVLRREQKSANDSIAGAEVKERERLIADMKEVKKRLQTAEVEQKELAVKREKAWHGFPNLIFDDVPDGGEEDFEVIHESPARPDLSLRKSYLELAGPEMIDLERAAKVSASRFVFLKGQLARLQMGLVSWAFDALEKHGFTPVIPPMLINEKAMGGMGYLDAHADEVYKTQDDLYLIGTSEQAIGPMYMSEKLLEKDLPLRYAGYSTCFRREAGSYGRDVKGILRVHQFDKVEMFSFTSAAGDASAQEHEFLLERQKKLMDALKLPYQVVKLAARDLGAPSAKTYDIQTWIPSEGTYRETHSTSNTTDYPARRLGIKNVHMLNGTAFAIGRILIAIMENYQQADGRIEVPEVLKSYVPFEQIG